MFLDAENKNYETKRKQNVLASSIICRHDKGNIIYIMQTKNSQPGNGRDFLQYYLSVVASARQLIPIFPAT